MHLQQLSKCVGYYIVTALIYFPHQSYSSDLSGYSNCIFNITDSNNITAEYNLTWFHLDSETFIVADDNDVKNFKYQFNICGAIGTTAWNSLSSCDDPSGSSSPCTTFTENGTCSGYFNVSDSIASAVQVNENNGNCHWVGVEVPSSYNMANYNISLYDNTDSAKGIKYTIFNGEYCGDGYGMNRELTIELVCPDMKRYVFDPSKEAAINESVVEYPNCVYTITYESPLACPNQCIAKKVDGDEYNVCNGNGICVSDPNAGYVRCICDDGYTGDSCDIVQIMDVVVLSTTHQALVTSIVICIVLLVLAILLALYFCHKIRLKEETVAGSQRQYAQSMLSDNPMVHMEPGVGTSMGIVTSRKQPGASTAHEFDPRATVDPSVQNEITNKMAQERLGTNIGLTEDVELQEEINESDHDSNNDENEERQDDDNDNDIDAGGPPAERIEEDMLQTEID